MLVNTLNSDPNFLPLCLCATMSHWQKKKCLNLVKLEQQPVGAVVPSWPAEKCQLLCSCVCSTTVTAKDPVYYLLTCLSADLSDFSFRNLKTAIRF